MQDPYFFICLLKYIPNSSSLKPEIPRSLYRNSWGAESLVSPGSSGLTGIRTLQGFCLVDPCKNRVVLQKSSLMKTLIRILSVSFVTVSAFTAALLPLETQAGELLYDSSKDGGRQSWEFTDPDAWDLTTAKGDPMLVLHGESRYEPAVRSPFNIAWLKGLETSGFILEVEAMSTSREYGHRDLCFFFGRQSESRFYYVHIASQADPHANSVFLVNDEPRVSIADTRTDGTQWIDGKFHKIRIERTVSDGKIRVFFDDMEKPIMEATDKTFTSGRVGLGSFDDVGQFRNLKIYSDK